MLVVTKNFAMLGFLIVFLQVVVESIESLMADDNGQLGLSTMHLRFGLVFPIFAMLSMAVDLKQVAKIADFGAVAVVTVCGGIMFGSFMRFLDTTGQSSEEHHYTSPVYDFNPQGPMSQWPTMAAKAMAFFLFTFAILSTLPTLRSQLEDPTVMPSVLNWSFTYICGVYIAVMGLGYLGFGRDAAENVIIGFSNGTATSREPVYPMTSSVVAGAMVVSILLSAPLFTLCIMSVFEASGNTQLHTPLSRPNIIFRVSLVFVLALASHNVPFVIEVVGIVSSIFGVCNNVFFPVCLFHKAKQYMPHPVSGTKTAQHVGIVAIGCCVLVFGLTGSIAKLQEKLAAQAAASATTSMTE